MSVGRGRLADHPYVRWGEGPPLVVIAGLNDPLCRVTESLPFAVVSLAFCRRAARAFDRSAYFVSRPSGHAPGTTTREMAEGYADVLAELGGADVLGLSMGGFVAHHLADLSGRVRSLVLGLAATRLSPAGRRTVRKWREWARRGEWSRFYHAGVDAVSGGVANALGHVVAAGYARFHEPRVPDDVVVECTACLDHEAPGPVDAPALVVGGTRDPFFDEREFAAAADALGGEFARVDGAGHEALVHRAGEFDGAVASFLARSADRA